MVSARSLAVSIRSPSSPRFEQDKTCFAQVLSIGCRWRWMLILDE